MYLDIDLRKVSYRVHVPRYRNTESPADPRLDIPEFGDWPRSFEFILSIRRPGFLRNNTTISTILPVGSKVIKTNYDYYMYYGTVFFWLFFCSTYREQSRTSPGFTRRHMPHAKGQVAASCKTEAAG